MVPPSQPWMVGDTAFDRDAARSAKIWFIGIGIEGDVRVDALSEILELISGSR